MAAGLQARLRAGRIIELKRPPYDFQTQSGTRIRNGLAIRRFSLKLGGKVRREIEGGRFPIVIGGDCSLLLGCLWGARTAGGKGLVHIDAHPDFFHPRNPDDGPLGAAAGMDLALATGRGEPMLTEWPDIGRPLARDEDVIQVGARDASRQIYRNFVSDVGDTVITRVMVHDVLRKGPEAASASVVERMATKGLDRCWLHVDLDVLDRSVMPAVDSPGSPGLDFGQLGTLLRALTQSKRIVGADVAIYDPELDPEGVYAARIVAMLGSVFAPSVRPDRRD